MQYFGKQSYNLEMEFYLLRFGFYLWDLFIKIWNFIYEIWFDKSKNEQNWLTVLCGLNNRNWAHN